MSGFSSSRIVIFGVALLASPLTFTTSACSSTQPDPSLLRPGQSAPGLSATSHDGKALALDTMRGQFVVVYFYPKDDTPGCTKEACAFRDAWDRLEAEGIVVIGVSTDDPQSHRDFAAKYQLPFSLVSDTDLQWAKAFGVGTTAGMTHRVTFLIGPDGTIAKVYPEVDPALHAEQILTDAKTVKAG